jgi:hypothetical protein
MRTISCLSYYLITGEVIFHITLDSEQGSKYRSNGEGLLRSDDDRPPSFRQGLRHVSMCESAFPTVPGSYDTQFGSLRSESQCIIPQLDRFHACQVSGARADVVRTGNPGRPAHHFNLQSGISLSSLQEKEIGMERLGKGESNRFCPRFTSWDCAILQPDTEQWIIHFVSFLIGERTMEPKLSSHLTDRGWPDPRDLDSVR